MSKILKLTIIAIVAFGVILSFFALNSCWRGKTAIFVGDSITEGRFAYPVFASSILGIESYKRYAIAGRTLCVRDTNDSPPIVSIWDTFDNNADIVFMLIGTNDYSSQVPLGDNNSLSPREFNGALNIVLPGLKEKYPDKLIVMSTLLNRTNDSKTIPATTYSDAIRQKCKQYNVVVFDGVKDTGLDFRNDKLTTKDGLHPNVNGSIILGYKVARFINNQ